MMPTKQRNPSSVLLEINGKLLMFDCGEGTQRQMRTLNLPLSKLQAIFITHWHGDHVLGLPGIIQSLGADGFHSTLHVYGPAGFEDHFQAIMRCCVFERVFPVEYHGVTRGQVCQTEEYMVAAEQMLHTVSCLGYKFVEKDRRRLHIDKIRKWGVPHGPLLGKLQKGEDIIFKGKNITSKQATYPVKGKKIAILLDTAPNKAAIRLAQNADVLVCEATFDHTLMQKAHQYAHMTSTDAAEIAKSAKVKKLVLTHFSPRYKNVKMLKDEAQKTFKSVVMASDLMQLEIK